MSESTLAQAGAISSVDLLGKDHHCLVRTSEPRNPRWMCRLLILCAPLAQSLAAVTVWPRRTFTSLVNVELQYMMNMGWPTKHKSAAYDVFNGAYTIGGTVTILHSRVLETILGDARSRPKHHRAPYPVHSFASVLFIFSF
ncbi:hypothetical protein IFR05_010402 [Cadophora sp. M221]|nr:hypothetical protein IFR05_010402 [Cadophora sp. M221]